jgi:hypothetical protein
MSPISIAASRAASRCDRILHLARGSACGEIGGIGFEQQMAAAGEIEAEIDPRHAAEPQELAVDSGIRLGTASSITPPAGDDRRDFQRGKSSMGSVVGGLGGAGA